jgi:hypothetical protein
MQLSDDHGTAQQYRSTSISTRFYWAPRLNSITLIV